MSRILLLTATPILLVGCGSTTPPRLMETPEVFVDGLYDPFETLAKEDRSNVVEVLYATDRMRPTLDERERGKRFYGNGRGHIIKFGTVSVRIGGPDTTWEEVEEWSTRPPEPVGGEERPLIAVVEETPFGELSNSLWNYDDPRDPAALAAGEARYVQAIEAKLAESASDDLFLFVHGVNSSFQYPLLVAAELTHYTAHDCTIIGYSWPAAESRFGYFRDVEAARGSARGLRLLLTFLAERTSAKQIHVICYSAGARIVSEALFTLRLMHMNLRPDELQEKFRFGHLVYLAPDLDFEDLKAKSEDGFGDIAEDFTVYVSSADKPLGLSKLFFFWKRLGRATASELTQEELRLLIDASSSADFIDVTGASDYDTGNGHSYFNKSSWVSSDLLMGLLFEARAKDRGLFREEGDPIWRFPRDYPGRLESIVDKLIAESSD